MERRRSGWQWRRGRPAAWALAAVMALNFAAGCGDDLEPMWIDLDRFMRHLGSLEDGMRDHGVAVQRSTDAAAMTAVERRFAATAREHAGGMAARLHDMQHLCARADGQEPELAALSVALDEVSRDVVVHVSSMALSSSAAVARDEEHRYQAVAPVHLGELRAHAAELAEQAAAYLCELHN